MFSVSESAIAPYSGGYSGGGVVGWVLIAM